MPDRVVPAMLTVPEAAAWLAVSPSTVRSQIRQGRIPAVRVGRYVRIPRAALAAAFQLVPDGAPSAVPAAPSAADRLAALLGGAEEALGGAAGPLPAGAWSPSRLAAWLQCPARGAWDTGVWPLPADFRRPPRPAADRGHVVHAYAAGRLLGLGAEAAAQAAQEQAADLPPEDWAGFAAAWERDVRPRIGRPRAVEQRLAARIGGLPVTAVLDVVGEDGTVRDLKTTARTPDPQALAWESLQAPIYTEAWRQATGERAGFALDVLVGHRRGVEAAAVPIPVPPGAVGRIARQLAWAQDQADHPDRIAPNPVGRFGCARCDYRTVCARRFGFPDAPAPTDTDPALAGPVGAEP